nr:MAG TPA: hypothetical protein [Caudoviricetes sp.]
MLSLSWKSNQKSGEPLPWANGIAPARKCGTKKDIAPLRADCVTHV